MKTAILKMQIVQMCAIVSRLADAIDFAAAPPSPPSVQPTRHGYAGAGRRSASTKMVVHIAVSVHQRLGYRVLSLDLHRAPRLLIPAHAARLTDSDDRRHIAKSNSVRKVRLEADNIPERQ